MSSLLKLLQHGHKSTTVRWAGVFGALWAAVLGLDWAGISPEFLDGLPSWAVIGVGILQSFMMAMKRADTDTALENK